MKRNAVVAVLTVLALAIAGTLLQPIRAEAGDGVVTSKIVRWKEVGAIVLTDTTFMTDETDTTRTEWISTDDWDWPAILAQGSVATGYAAARITFVASRATNGVTDTINFLPEFAAGGPDLRRQSTVANNLKPDTMFTHNGTIVATVGSVAVANFQTDPVWQGILWVDPDTPEYTTKAAWLAPKFRLRVCGDVSGSTPKLSGLFCIISYLKRAGAR